MSAGLYCIVNLLNGFRLVASSKDLDNGIKEAWYKLQCGKYWCFRLQKDFGQNPTQFQIEILETCEPNQLQERKKVYIEAWLPQYNYAGLMEKNERQLGDSIQAIRNNLGDGGDLGFEKKFQVE